MFPEEIGLGSTSPISLPNQKKGLRYSKEYIVDRAKNILLPKRDHLVRQLTRLGLKASHLATQQLIELFYDIYNPSVTGAQRLATRSSEYLSPIVSSASEIRQQAGTSIQNATPDALAPEMSPGELLGDIYGKTPVQQQATAQGITGTQNPPAETMQRPETQFTAGTPPLPQTSWNQAIQNTQQSPWPAPAAPTTTPGNTPFSPGIQVNNPLQQISPAYPVQNTVQQQTQPPSQQATDQVITNLQKAIEDARRKASQYNGASNTNNIPTVPANLDRK
jgi:hypothetical protein